LGLAAEDGLSSNEKAATARKKRNKKPSKTDFGVAGRGGGTFLAQEKA